MGYTEGTSPKGGPSFNNTPQTTADFQRLRDYIEQQGNARVGVLAEMNALVAPERYDGLTFYATDVGRTFIYQGGWIPLTQRVLGLAAVTGPVVVAVTPGWTDVVSLTATTHGGVCDVEWMSLAYNAASGATRSFTYRVTVDGVQIGSTLIVDLTTSTGNGQAQSFIHSSTPAAGSHTWKLQANCSAAAACGFKNSTIKVTER